MKKLTWLLAAVVLVTVSCGSSSDDSDMPEFLFFQHSDSATLTESTLKLTGVSPQTGWFTNRPYRGAGQTLTEEFISRWGQGDDSFADDPPNADLACTVNGEVVNYVVELMSPELIGDELTYEIQVLGGVEPPLEMVCDNPAHLFIDYYLSIAKTGARSL